VRAIKGFQLKPRFYTVWTHNGPGYQRPVAVNGEPSHVSKTGYLVGWIPHGVASLIGDAWAGRLMLVQLNDIGDDLRDFGVVEGRTAA
jgi:hypothetical protein